MRTYKIVLRDEILDTYDFCISGVSYISENSDTFHFMDTNEDIIAVIRKDLVLAVYDKNLATHEGWFIMPYINLFIDCAMKSVVLNVPQELCMDMIYNLPDSEYKNILIEKLNLGCPTDDFKRLLIEKNLYRKDVL